MTSKPRTRVRLNPVEYAYAKQHAGPMGLTVPKLIARIVLAQRARLAKGTQQALSAV